jgi:hypothetical protein
MEGADLSWPDEYGAYPGLVHDRFFLRPIEGRAKPSENVHGVVFELSELPNCISGQVRMIPVGTVVAGALVSNSATLRSLKKQQPHYFSALDYIFLVLPSPPIIPSSNCLTRE